LGIWELRFKKMTKKGVNWSPHDNDPPYPVLEVDFGKPVHGYWDGGAKQHLTFSPSPKQHQRGGTIQWGSFSANFWFNAGAGKSWTEAASIAKRKLQRMIRKDITGITVEWTR
jgi:hypothetical protein